MLALQGAFRHDVHLATQHLLQILLDCDEVEETSALLEAYEHIQVAVRVRVAEGDRAEDADIVCAVLLREFLDFHSAAADFFEVQFETFP